MTGCRITLCCLLCILVFSTINVSASCRQQYSMRVARILHKVGQQLETGASKQALALLSEFRENYPAEKHFILFSHLGNLHAENGNNEDALVAYTQALDLCRDEAALWQNQARVAWDLKNYELAETSLLEAWQIKPSDELLFNVVLARIHAGKKAQALDTLEELLNRSTRGGRLNWVEAYVDLCLDQKRVKRGLSALQHWRQDYEHEPQFWYLQTLFHVRLNDSVQAAACLDIMASFRPLQESEKKLLADLLLQAKVPLRAAELYRQLLTLQPQSMELLQQLVIAYRLGGQLPQALGVINKALTLRNTAGLLRQKGEICFELQSYQESLDAFSALIELKGDSGPVYLFQAYCALKLKKNSLARKILKRAMAYKSEKKKAVQLLAWLDRSGATE